LPSGHTCSTAALFPRKRLIPPFDHASLNNRQRIRCPRCCHSIFNRQDPNRPGRCPRAPATDRSRQLQDHIAAPNTITITTTTLTDPREPSCGESASSSPSFRHYLSRRLNLSSADVEPILSTTADSPYPPPFSSLFFPSDPSPADSNKAAAQPGPPEQLPAFSSEDPLRGPSSSAAAAAVAETKAALPRDTKDGSSSKDFDDGEPPPPYTEGSSPIEGFTYVMATAGGPASIITQVSQGTGAPVNALAGKKTLKN